MPFFFFLPGLFSNCDYIIHLPLLTEHTLYMPRSTSAGEILPNLNSFGQVMAFLLLLGKQFTVLQMLLYASSSKDHLHKIMSINIWTPNIKSLTFTITLGFACCQTFFMVLLYCWMSSKFYYLIQLHWKVYSY